MASGSGVNFIRVGTLFNLSGQLFFIAFKWGIIFIVFKWGIFFIAFKWAILFKNVDNYIERSGQVNEGQIDTVWRGTEYNIP